MELETINTLVTEATQVERTTKQNDNGAETFMVHKSGKSFELSIVPSCRFESGSSNPRMRSWIDVSLSISGDDIPLFHRKIDRTKRHDVTWASTIVTNASQRHAARVNSVRQLIANIIS